MLRQRLQRVTSQHVLATVVLTLVLTGARADDEPSLAETMQAQRQVCSSLSQQELVVADADCLR